MDDNYDKSVLIKKIEMLDSNYQQDDLQNLNLSALKEIYTNLYNKINYNNMLVMYGL